MPFSLVKTRGVCFEGVMFARCSLSEDRGSSSSLAPLVLLAYDRRRRIVGADRIDGGRKALIRDMAGEERMIERRDVYCFRGAQGRQLNCFHAIASENGVSPIKGALSDSYWQERLCMEA